MTTLKTMLASEQTRIEEIGAWLDAQSLSAQLDAAFSLGRDGQHALFDRAHATGLTLEHFVPGDVPDLQEVRHAGKNTLPIPGNQHFDKCFSRPSDHSQRLFGYNRAPARWLVGPGYFVADYTRSQAEWAKRGAIIFDCYQVPDGAVPAGWPKVVRNSQGLRKIAYGKTRDFMREVSTRVSIGSVYMGERPLGSYFILVRRDR